MTRRAHGTVRHNTVILDEPVPDMEGRRVEIELREEAAPEVEAQPAARLLDAWTHWAASGNQGPILDEPDAWP